MKYITREMQALFDKPIDGLDDGEYALLVDYVDTALDMLEKKSDEMLASGRVARVSID